MSVAIDLSDQVVLVTGGTGGIGRAIVEQMLEAGACVAFCAVGQAQCDQVAAELNQRFASSGAARAIGIAADLRDRASLAALAAAVVERCGRIDTLVCNAANFGEFREIEDVDCDAFAQVLDNNVVNNFHLSRCVLPQMLQHGSGSIVFITSIVAHSSMPSNVSYAASKAALTSLARSMAARYAADGIRINCIAPGLIKTEGSRSVWADPAIARSFYREKIPMQRIGEPEEIARMCVFLASPLASYITAVTMHVDGGRFGVGQPAGSNAQIKKDANAAP